MKIVSIFAESLFAFHFDNEDTNELSRLLAKWNDIEYLFNFVEEHKADISSRENIEQLPLKLIELAYELDDTLQTLSIQDSPQLAAFFKPLHNQEYRQTVELSKQKGRKRYLRLYAIKIDNNCFVITGGAIKFTQTMQEREHTALELRKLDKCYNYLKEEGIIDEDSFYEYLNEQDG